MGVRLAPHISHTTLTLQRKVTKPERTRTQTASCDTILGANLHMHLLSAPSHIAQQTLVALHLLQQPAGNSDFHFKALLHSSLT